MRAIAARCANAGSISDGSLVGAAPLAALLVAEVMAVIADDPFFGEGVTDRLTVTRWRPVFGRFAQKTDGLGAAITATTRRASPK